MKKGKAITLFSIIAVIMVLAIVFTFVPFPIGIKNYNSVVGAIDLDYDINGGVSYTVSLDRENEEEVKDVNEVLSTLSQRLNSLGYKSYSLTAVKEANEAVEDYSIRLSLKKTENVESDVKAVFAYGSIKFYGGTSESPTTEIMNEGKAVKNAYYAGVSTESSSTPYITTVEFTDYGYKTLKSALDANENYYLKITLGEDELLNGAISSSAITNKSVSVNVKSEAAARQFAMQIKTGGLSYKYNLDDLTQVNAAPLLGENIPVYAAAALGVLFAVIVAAMIVLFRGYGIIGGLSLLLFEILELAFLIAIPGIVVSFAGLVGIGVATVICADGLVIVVKRIREEYMMGKTVKASVKTGYRRSLFPVLGTNLITLFIGLMIFALTSGAVQALGITLAIGSVLSFVSVILFSRMFTELLLPMTDKKEKFLKLKREDN